MQRCTVFVIAHRLSTVRSAHRVFVLEEGQLLEQGNPRELLVKGGRYAQLHWRQFQ
jgi:ATP-binding cassette subfamily B protein